MTEIRSRALGNKLRALYFSCQGENQKTKTRTLNIKNSSGAPVVFRRDLLRDAWVLMYMFHPQNMPMSPPTWKTELSGVSASGTTRLLEDVLRLPLTLISRRQNGLEARYMTRWQLQTNRANGNGK